MQHFALGMTNRSLLAVWLEHAMASVSGWRLAGILPRTHEAARAVLGRGNVHAILVDVAGDGAEVLTLCEHLSSQRLRVPVLAVSCCGRDRDDTLARLLRAGVSGYVVLDDDEPSLGAELTRALLGSHGWPVDRMAGLIRHLQDGPDSLSALDRELIRLCARGLRYRDIARQVPMSQRTVRHRVDDLRLRAGAPTVAALVAWAARRGVLAHHSVEDAPFALERRDEAAGLQ